MKGSDIMREYKECFTIDKVLTGHIYYGSSMSAYECVDSCGTCDGARCDSCKARYIASYAYLDEPENAWTESCDSLDSAIRAVEARGGASDFIGPVLPPTLFVTNINVPGLITRRGTRMGMLFTMDQLAYDGIHDNEHVYHVTWSNGNSMKMILDTVNRDIFEAKLAKAPRYSDGSWHTITVDGKMTIIRNGHDVNGCKVRFKLGNNHTFDVLYSKISSTPICAEYDDECDVYDVSIGRYTFQYNGKRFRHNTKEWADAVIEKIKSSLAGKSEDSADITIDCGYCKVYDLVDDDFI